MDTALVIMAAGIGSRFGEGIKQLHTVGKHGELIIDYSIHDAVKAGFRKIVLIISREIERDFEEIFGKRMRHILAKYGVEVDVVFQEMDDIPEGASVPEGRVKPWGTGQAVLACRDVIREPFLVINADDYYGETAFIQGHAFLKECAGPDESSASNAVEIAAGRIPHPAPLNLCMAGYVLKNTMSRHGGVTRGVCSMDRNGYLKSITETHELRMEGGMARGWYETPDGQKVPCSIPPDATVSMNMWGLTPEFIHLLEKEFERFFRDIRRKGTELTEEFILPTIIGHLLEKGRVRVKVLNTGDKWFGMTFREDAEAVKEEIRDLIASGVYAEELFSDL
ncbi:MAG: nucleotidyltransferase family protein [Anaerovoracaceae bacterium]|jgi:hypothetical protein